MGIARVAPPTPPRDTQTRIVYAAAANTVYTQTLDLPPASYLITCVSTTNVNISMVAADGTVIVSGTTTSGSLVLVPTSPVRFINYFTNTGTNIAILIALQGEPFTTAATGTLDTLTTTQTYTQTGHARVCVVGGGGGGGGNNLSSRSTPNGGGSGGVNVPATAVRLTGSISVVIGAAGTGVTGANGTNGGTTSFGAITATGGGGGPLGNATQESWGPGGAPGSPGGGFGASPAIVGPFDSASGLPVFNGTTGGGGWGAGGGGFTPNAGFGSGIGTGGAGGNNSNGGNATGFGAGGGGAGNSVLTGLNTVSRAGGNGTAGVVYVLRWS